MHYTQRDGVYMDTDVLMYKPLYDFENEEGFTGFEDKNYPVTATMRCYTTQPSNKVNAGLVRLHRI